LTSRVRVISDDSSLSRGIFSADKKTIGIIFMKKKVEKNK